MLDNIAELLTDHIVLPRGGPEAIAPWVLHAHAHGAAQISAILALVSPEHVQADLSLVSPS